MYQNVCSDTLPRFRVTPCLREFVTPCFLTRDILPSARRDTLPVQGRDTPPLAISPPGCLTAHEKPQGGTHQ